LTVLTWDKPKQVISVDEWKNICADGVPPGVYTPNMSEEDRKRWKAKLVGKTTDDPRVEIRVCHPCQILIVVRPDGVARMTMNGGAEFSIQDLADFQIAIHEALEKLAELRNS